MERERNITEQREAEASMRESEERFRAAFATIPDAINIGRAVDGVNIAVNQGFCRLTGWSEAEAVGVAGKAHFLTVTQDNTERKQAEEALRASERRFRALIGNSSDGVMVIDTQGLSLFSSASVNRLLGEGSEAPGLPILELVHPDDFARCRRPGPRSIGSACSLPSGWRATGPSLDR